MCIRDSLYTAQDKFLDALKIWEHRVLNSVTEIQTALMNMLPAAGFFTIRKRNILKIYHGKIPPAEIIGEAIAQNTTRQQNKISTTSAKLNLSRQILVRLTGAPRPRVIAAAESASPIFTEQVIIGISLYSNIFEDFCFLCVPVAGLLALTSCAKDEDESYVQFENQALEAWMTQHRPDPVSYTHLDVYKRQNSRGRWPLLSSC